MAIMNSFLLVVGLLALGICGTFYGVCYMEAQIDDKRVIDVMWANFKYLFGIK
jgi:hypothetical protein